MVPDVKAFLLAGGLGSRLRPYTDHTPKCLVEIGGEPLLAIWLRLCARHGVREVLVNVTRHPDAVRRLLQTRAPEAGVVVTLVEEAAPLGSAGTLLANQAFIDDDRSFFVLYADNLTSVDLSRLAAYHETHDGVATMGLFRAPRPEQAGIVHMDPRGRVVAFEEKPAVPSSNLANAGVYVCRPDLFAAIPRRAGIVDLALDVWPQLKGRLYGCEITEYLADIGTPDGLEAARRAWPTSDGARR